MALRFGDWVRNSRLRTSAFCCTWPERSLKVFAGRSVLARGEGECQLRHTDVLLERRSGRVGSAIGAPWVLGVGALSGRGVSVPSWGALRSRARRIDFAVNCASGSSLRGFGCRCDCGSIDGGVLRSTPERRPLRRAGLHSMSHHGLAGALITGAGKT